jgi:hypothetical protein
MYNFLTPLGLRVVRVVVLVVLDLVLAMSWIRMTSSPALF